MTDSTIARLRETAKSAQRNADYPNLESIARELIARSETHGDGQMLGDAYAYLGAALVGRGDGNGARVAFRRSRVVLEKAGDRMGVVRSLNGTAVAFLDIELNAVAARRYLDEALAMVRIERDPMWTGIVLGNLCEQQRFGSDYAAAIASATEALAIFTELAEHSRAAWQLINIAHCRFLSRHRDSAVAAMRSAYRFLQKDRRDARVIGWYFDVWFVMAASLSQWEVAARLMGYVSALHATKNLVRLPSMLPWIAPMRERLRAELSDADFDAFVRDGFELSMEEANDLTETIRTG